MTFDEISDESNDTLKSISRKLFDGDAAFVEQDGKTFKIRNFPSVSKNYHLYTYEKPTQP